MCGISGIYSKKNVEIGHELISKVNNIASHRGPDAEQYYLNKNFAFGHRRLSIIDLSSESNQPFSKFEFTIVYNGEIFNYLEIRQELLLKGYEFQTQSDTEVILVAYKEWGKECVSRFNGMWAFCIYNETTQSFFCSRDRFGIKPFYFINNSEYFSFASEIPQLLALLKENKANRKVLAEFMVGIEDFTDETFFQDVFKLLPGFNLEFSFLDKKITKWRYYELKKVEVPKNYDLCIHEFKALFKDSIKLRLRSDVIVGTCLSGGLDSSAIAAVASKLFRESSHTNFMAIHAKSFEKATDESYYAKLVAEHSALNLFIVEPDSSSLTDVLNKTMKVQGEPFGGPSIVMQYCVFEEAAKQNIKVMLDGQGGDELLLGYDTYFNRYLSTIPFVNYLFKKLNLSSETLMRLNLKFAYNFKRINSRVKRMLHSKRFAFINEEYFSKVDHLLVFESAMGHSKNTFMFQKYEMEKGIQKLLKYEDRNSMFHGIESRLPFLDHRLVEYALSLPLDIKLHDNETKHILRKSIKDDVLDEVAYRMDKKGFEAPSIFWGIYYNNSLEAIRNSKIVKDMIVGEIPDDRMLQWKLANIAHWEATFDVTL